MFWVSRLRMLKSGTSHEVRNVDGANDCPLLKVEVLKYRVHTTGVVSPRRRLQLCIRDCILYIEDPDPFEFQDQNLI